jgi:hypothetical protein
MKISAVAVVLTMLGSFACSGGKSGERGEAGSDAGADVGSDASSLPIGANYFCNAGDGGRDDAGSSCVVGQTYCFVMLPRPPTTSAAASSCRTYSNSTAACAVNPTCECLCATAYHCQTECRCSETGGFATVSCEPI